MSPRNGWAVSALIALLLLCLGAAAQQVTAIPPGNYQLQAADSQLAIVLHKTGLLSALADNHLIEAEHMQGRATGSAGGWSGEVTAPVAALEVADPGRSAQDRHAIWVTMESPEQLDASRFPTIVWRLTSLTPAATGYLLRGTFTIHGVTRTVAWPTKLEVRNGTVHVWGQATLRLTDFGVQPIRRALGTVRVKNQFELRWNTVWERS